MTKKLLFKVTAKDCDWEYYRGSGNGGQKRQKTSSAVRCRHKPSGAIGQAQDHRSQKQNKRLAFRRMAETRKFKDWIKLTVSRISGAQAEAQRYAEREIDSSRVRVEVKKDGKWILEES
jgi:protein subunit release factor B